MAAIRHPEGGPVQSLHDARRTVSGPRCESRSIPGPTDKRTRSALNHNIAPHVNTITQVTISMCIRPLTSVEWRKGVEVLVGMSD
jgi:hypothetical protein